MNYRLEQHTENDCRVLMILPSEGEATAEELATLQALYSRDPRPIDDAVKLLKASDGDEFMRKFYVGYGHESVAELGDVTIAIENIPMPVAKLIQHDPLYRGQECSTRYIDFSKQKMIARTEAGAAYVESLRAFYLKALPATIQKMCDYHNLDAAEPVEYKAAKASAFDVLRGFLPNGSYTNVAWRVNLRDLNNKINYLQSIISTYPELQDVVTGLEVLMARVFPMSRRVRKITPIPDLSIWNAPNKPVVQTHDFGPGSGHLALPRSCNIIEVTGLLDFASWRDLVRHRSVSQTFPEIGTKYGFEYWYLNMLPDELHEEASRLIYSCPEDDMMAAPMGFRVPFRISGPEDKFRYIVKLRTSQTVHPTLRLLMIDVAEQLSAKGIDVEHNANKEWVVDAKRGTQDIVRK